MRRRRRTRPASPGSRPRREPQPSGEAAGIGGVDLDGKEPFEGRGQGQPLGGGDVEDEDLVARLEDAGIANARLRQLAEQLEYEQLAAWNRWRTVGGRPGRSSHYCRQPPWTASNR